MLQEVEQEIIHYKQCNEMLKNASLSNKDLVVEGMICGHKKGGKDACQVRGGPFSISKWLDRSCAAASSITS